MQEEKIIELLKNKFSEAIIHPYKRKIIFWYDEEGAYSEFVNSLPDRITKPSLKVFKITKNRKDLENNIFKIKYCLEYKDCESNYLIYTPTKRPLNRDNLLLDILLYSEEFIADEPSMIIEEFGFPKDYRGLIKRYCKFFDSKNRKQKLKNILPDSPKEEEIKLGMLAILTNTKILNFEEVLKSIFMKNLDEENEYYQSIQKFASKELLETYIEKYFGLDFKEKTLRNLFNNLLLIHMFYTIKSKPPLQLDNKAKSKLQSVYVFIEHWINSLKDRNRFLELANSVETELNISSHINNIEFEKVILINTFKTIDKYILDKISSYILDGFTDYTSYKEWINLRRDISPWDEGIKSVYQTLQYAVELLNISKGFEVREQDSDDIYSAYISKYYRIDLFYRKFYECYDKIKMMGLDKIDKIQNKIEKLYLNKLQAELMGRWDKSIENIKENWRVLNYNNQHKFYNTYVEPIKNRVFVITSDALRYEVATEAVNLLSRKIENNKIELDSLFGNAPSYTRLGMASLLPHNDKMEFANGDIKINGMEVNSTINREKVLFAENQNSLALQYDKIKKSDRDEIRQLCKGKDVVYIYHNTIDSTGDDRSSEIGVFDACRNAINDLLELTKYLVNNLSAKNILITSDHGFIYQRESLEGYDKLETNDISNIITTNKRYIYTQDNNKKDGTISINMNYVFKDTDIYSLIPKENFRFKLKGGGINFVHGGASLQEIVIPVIKYKTLSSSKVDVSKVNLEFISLSRKIRNNVTKFKFIQVEAVNEMEKTMPRTVKIGLYDGINPISNEKQLSINSTEENSAVDVSLTLKAIDFDKAKDYYLRVLDIENGEILFDEKYKIDIGIVNDFEF